MRALRNKVRDYYSGTIERYGPTPLGVDWPNAASQYLRFVQLLRICDFERPFSLNDFGCGYGALLEFLAMRQSEAEVAYHGIDISPSMVAVARDRWSSHPRATFTVASRCGHLADYSVVSGVFNVRLGQPVENWEPYIDSILTDIKDNSRIGFAVNFMLPHDHKPTEQALYRSGPQRWVGFCERQLDCTVELLTGYGLREFTLLVRIRP